MESKALLSLIYSVRSSHSTGKETQINISIYFPIRLAMTINGFRDCDGRAQGATRCNRVQQKYTAGGISGSL